MRWLPSLAHDNGTWNGSPRAGPSGIWADNSNAVTLQYNEAYANKSRSIPPVPAGTRIRLRQRLLNAEEVEDHGLRITSQMTMEVEGSERPAMVAETISVVYG